ncbi:MAG TPA: menaquinone biosynthesis protein [Candidatus Sumerlaeota bacterium]|nr:menaquinone biosynthesis protein [Candidatus Sumerlaeota bacterium]
MDKFTTLALAAHGVQRKIVPAMIRPLRLGVVPYLNVLPLLEGLDADYPKTNWLAATPRRLAELLAGGEIDVAMVSIFEALLHADKYRIVPGVAIGCDGPVRSVALHSKVPLKEIKTVLLDRASLSSANLVQILCRELLNIDPQFHVSENPFAPGFDWKTDSHDALLVIGDTALAWEHAFPHRLDLGMGWKELTGLPFVFAAWVAREGLEVSRDEVNAFVKAKDRGIANAEVIADRYVGEAGHEWVTRESAREYLTSAIKYDLGEWEREGLILFRQKLVEHRLLGGGGVLR